MSIENEIKIYCSSAYDSGSVSLKINYEKSNFLYNTDLKI